MYKLKEAMKKFCCDLLASQQRKCDCALAGMTTWRFSSHRKVIKSLLMGTGYKPLQSVNYHDSRAHGYERSGVIVGLVGFGMAFVGVFFTGKNRVVKIVHSSSDVVLRTTKHTLIYPGLGPSLEVIALRPAA
jgi:Na+/melibiose symporter-like transporter